MKDAVKKVLSLLVAGGVIIAPNFLVMPANAEMLMAQTASATQYWQDSVDLLQAQIDLLNRVERSLYSPQRSEVNGSYRQLFFSIGNIDRYLAKYGVVPRVTCTNSRLSAAQLTVYCGLWRSRDTLYTLLDTMSQRQSQLSNAEDSLLFPIGGSSLLSSDLIPQESWQNQANGTNLVVIGISKPARNMGETSLPAIAPLPNTVTLITKQKQALLALQSQLPAAYQLEDIDIFATTNTRYQYQPLPEEYATYSTFLAQPNTGLSRLLPKDAYEEIYLTSSLQPSIKEQYPFTRFNDSKPLPNLPLVIQNEQLTLIPEALNIGLITDLGETEFTAIQSLDQGQPILNYQSPNTFQALQQEQRRFIFQKSASEVTNTAPLSLNHLYLVRLIQYEFAPEILEGKLLPRQRFKELNNLIDPTSYDVLVAVKPVKNWLDGGYTLLWQLVEQKSATQVEDLADYITVDSPDRP